jgi:hypothetical protein
MYETYKMLGAEREAELLREAERLHRLPSSRWRARLARAWSPARRRGAVRRGSGTERLEPTAEARSSVD